MNAAVLQPQGAFTRPVTMHGYTVYANARGETVTGAIPMDAVRGFAPAKVGRSYGPNTPQPGCTEGDLPPQSVRDHATFTAAELRRYNLPSASDLGIPFDEWATMVRAAKHVACTVKMTYDDGHYVTGSLSSEKGAPTANPSARQVASDTCINFCGPEADINVTPPQTNCPGTSVFICVDRSVYHNTGGTDPVPSEPAWMGFASDRYICQVSSCPALTEAVSYWHIPTAYNKEGDAFDDALVWVGLGGLHYNPAATCSGTSAQPPSLVQAGTESEHYNGSAIYDAWYENCSSNSPGRWTVNLPVNPGDLMVAYTGYSSSAHPSAITLEDFTTGWTDTALDGPGVIWPAPDQNTAECVSEAPANWQWWEQPPGAWHGLSDFGTYGTATNGIHFEYCCAWTAYNTSTIMGIGSMPGDTLLNLRYYTVNGTPAYCESTVWFDTFDSTYGYTSYGETATVTTLEGGNSYC